MDQQRFILPFDVSLPGFVGEPGQRLTISLPDQEGTGYSVTAEVCDDPTACRYTLNGPNGFSKPFRVCIPNSQAFRFWLDLNRNAHIFACLAQRYSYVYWEPDPENIIEVEDTKWWECDPRINVGACYVYLPRSGNQVVVSYGLDNFAVATVIRDDPCFSTVLFAIIDAIESDPNLEDDDNE